MGNWLQDAWGGLVDFSANAVSGGEYGKAKSAMQAWNPQRDQALGNAPNAQKASEAFNRGSGTDAGKELVDPWSTSGKLAYPGTPEHAKALDYYGKLGGYNYAAPPVSQTPYQMPQANLNSAAAASAAAKAAIPQGNTHGMAGLYGPTYESTNQTPDQKAALAVDAFQQRNREVTNQVQAMKNPWDTNSIEFQKALAGEVNRTNLNNAGMVERVNGAMAGRGAAAKAAAAANAAAYQGQAVSGAESGMYKAALDGKTAFDFQKASALDSLNHNELGASQAYGSLWQQGQQKAQYERSQANMEKQQGIDNAWRASMQDYAKQTNMDAKEADFWHNAVGSIPGIAAFMKESGYSAKDVIEMIKGSSGGSAAGLGPLNGQTGAYGGGINYSYPTPEVPPLNFGLHF